MPQITTRDGTRLYVEDAGAGSAIVFIHEYAGDFRTWEPQMRFFARAHRCVTYSQRGYPPSDVPADPARYSQDLARDDVIAVMDALKIDKAHVVGHSMGALTALLVGLKYPERCLSVTAAGCGYGSSPDRKIVEETREASRQTGKMFQTEDFKDGWCLDSSVYLKRIVPSAGLCVIPRSGHTITSEEPAAFNAALADLIANAEAGRWMAHRGQ
jgi:pimeloyl-ACP methyl ester carboxylesterase